jgi:hypothetical protein
MVCESKNKEREEESIVVNEASEGVNNRLSFFQKIIL